MGIELVSPIGRRTLLPASMLRLVSDERLVEQIRAGSERAFEVLFDRHHRPVLAFCRHMLGSREEAEDAVQHTFMSAYCDLLRSSRPIAPRPWLLAIARNRCISILRSRREFPVDGRPLATGDLTTEVVRREELQVLLADLLRLPDEQRAALLLTEFGGVSHDEIGRMLGCPRDRVKALVYQARSALAATRTARDTPCVEIRTQLATLRGGALRRTVLRRHLRECPGCRHFHSEMRGQRRKLAALLPVVPGVGLKQGILGAVVGAGGAGGGGATLVAGAVGGSLAAKAAIAVAIATAGTTAGVVADGRGGGAPALPAALEPASLSQIDKSAAGALPSRQQIRAGSDGGAGGAAAGAAPAQPGPLPLSEEQPLRGRPAGPPAGSELAREPHPAGAAPADHVAPPHGAQPASEIVAKVEPETPAAPGPPPALPEGTGDEGSGKPPKTSSGPQTEHPVPPIVTPGGPGNGPGSNGGAPGRRPPAPPAGPPPILRPGSQAVPPGGSAPPRAEPPQGKPEQPPSRAPDFARAAPDAARVATPAGPPAVSETPSGSVHPDES